MTVKQIIVGTLLGITAIANLIHRLPKSANLAQKPNKQDTRTALMEIQTPGEPRRETSGHRRQKKHGSDDGITLNRTFG